MKKEWLQWLWALLGLALMSVPAYFIHRLGADERTEAVRAEERRVSAKLLRQLQGGSLSIPMQRDIDSVIFLSGAVFINVDADFAQYWGDGRSCGSQRMWLAVTRAAIRAWLKEAEPATYRQLDPDEPELYVYSPPPSMKMIGRRWRDSYHCP